MKILVLTSRPHEEFVLSVAGKHATVYCGDEPFPLDLELWQEEYVGVSFMYKHKVPAEHVNSCPWFNFHPAPLPEYKGRNLCYHAIMNGAKSFGATVHYMDENFDTGDIIEVWNFEIQDWMTAGDVSRHAINQSRNMFQVYFPRILSGEKFKRLPNRGGTYYKKTDITEKLILKPDEPFCQFVRAVTYKDFYPKIDIGGVVYKIVRDE